MFLKDLPKKEQARILTEMEDVFGKKAVNALRRTGFQPWLWVDDNALSPFLGVEYECDKASH